MTTDEVLARVPVPDLANPDPAVLEAWYGNFGFAEHWRKVVLANCYEIELATREKTSETRLKELARLNEHYLDFLATHLTGRILREREVKAAAGMGA